MMAPPPRPYSLPSGSRRPSSPGAVDAASVVRRGHILSERRACRVHLPRGVNGSDPPGPGWTHNGTGSEAHAPVTAIAPPMYEVVLPRTVALPCSRSPDCISHRRNGSSFAMTAFCRSGRRPFHPGNSPPPCSLRRLWPAARSNCRTDGIVAKRHAFLKEAPPPLVASPAEWLLRSDTLSPKGFPHSEEATDVVRHQPGAPVLDGQEARPTWTRTPESPPWIRHAYCWYLTSYFHHKPQTGNGIRCLPRFLFTVMTSAIAMGSPSCPAILLRFRPKRRRTCCQCSNRARWGLD